MYGRAGLGCMGMSGVLIGRALQGRSRDDYRLSVKFGARRRDQLAEGIAALDLRLTDEDLGAIEQAAPAGEVHGERYGAPQMADLDSER